MRNFDWQNATRIIFGKEVERQVGKEISKLGKRILFVHYGDGLIEKLGLYDTLVESLKEESITFFELTGVRPSPLLSKVYEGIELCRTHQIDCILAVGGGSVMDTAKAVAAGVCYEGDLWDCFDNKGTVNAALPVVAVVTYPATGSETNTGCVITNEKGMFKRWIDYNVLRPAIAFLNPELTYDLPPYLTACGIADMFTHALERYMSNDWNADLPDRVGEACMRSLRYTAPQVMRHPHDYDARAEIMYAGLFANNGQISMGKACGWESHAIGHELTAFYNVAHGATLSIVFPAWIKYVWKANPNRFLQYFVRVFDVDCSYQKEEWIIKEGLERFERYFHDLGLPVRMSEAGIDGSEISDMAKKAVSMGPLKGIRTLGQSDVEAIYRLAL